jgi:copper chaperone CopZ
MKRLVTTIDADMFENTAVGLERQLTRRAGIGHVDVNRATHTVTVDFDNGRLEPAEVKRLIAECGYRSFCLATEPR